MRVAPVLLFLLLAAPAAASPGGGSCLQPLRWTAHGAGMPAVSVEHGSQPAGPTLTVTMRTAGWRICALAGDGWRVPGTVGTGGHRSFATRLFTRGPRRVRITVARQSGADGASCANPFVVVADNGEGTGDTLAGRVRTVDDEASVSRTDPGGSVTRRAQWQSAIGYRPCFAAGLGAAGFGASDAFVDRRHGDSLSHVLDTFDCCPNHPPGWHYLYVALRRR